MKAWLGYAAVVAATVFVFGWIFTIFFPGEAARQAIGTSAAIACLVQLGGFAIARRMRRTNAIAGWAAGALLCLLSLVLYGFLVRPLGLPIEPALLSLAAFYFVTETLEPLLLTA